MATESSAIVRFIEIQQQRGIQATREPIPEPIVFAPAPARPEPQSSPGPRRWITGALVVGGLVAAGLYLGKDVLFGTGGQEPVAGGVAAGMPGAVAATEREHAADDAPPVAGKPAEAGAPAAEVTPLAVDGEPAARPVDTAAPQTSPNTGFDLRVKPSGAKISLDGKSIGVAPLRVRNVIAGAHVVDIEAPEGYFSQRLELAVELDRPQELRIDLAPIDNPPAARAATEPPAKKSSRSERRDEERRSRRERETERRAERTGLAPVKFASSAVPAEPAAAQAEAQPEPAAAAAPEAGSGTLRVGAKPPCKIFIDGKDTGLMTPQRALPLSAGKHSVKLVNQEFGIDKTMRVRIAPGKSTTVIKDFSSNAGL